MSNETVAKTKEIKLTKASSSRLQKLMVQILAFLGALILWFYVMGVNSPTYEKTYNDIPITIIGAEILKQNYGYTVLSGQDTKVDITIQGRRSDISKLNASDIQVQVDVSTLDTVGANVCSLNLLLPNGLKAPYISSSNVLIYIDRSISKSIPVKVTHTGYIATGLILGAYDPSPSTVTVEGPENAVNKIDGAYADLQLDKIEGSIKARQKLVLKDSDGIVITNQYITLRTTEVEVNIPVYIEKAVPINVEFIDGVYPIEQATITIDPATILVRGLVENMTDFNKVTLKVNESIIDGQYQTIIPISLPAGIENKSGKNAVDISIKLNNNSSRTVTINNFAFINKPDGLNYTLSPNSTSLKIKLLGLTSDVSTFDTTMDLVIKVDLSSLADKTSGTYQLPVIVDTNFDTTHVYPFGTYYVDIIVN